MEHTPYGYRIEGGRAVINEDQAASVRKICDSYLSGMSFKKAAASAGLNLSHSTVRRMIQNPRYLGDMFYPSILSEETAQKIEAERSRREKALGRDRRRKKEAPVAPICTRFTMPKIKIKYEDPIQQAEYAYSLVMSEG